MTVYVCGITPYDSAHLGHAFTYTHFDVLVRYLRHLGSEVLHAQNVTDVDDDILRAARKRGIDYLELAQRETAAFTQAMRALGNAEPTLVPRATEFVEAMVEEVKELLMAGHAYEREGTVYFRVSTDSHYGKLSRLSRAEMLRLAAERGGRPEDPAKDDPLDFVLWQRSAPGEPSWESPWGSGRPGWHIECSTMARRLLGQPVDIHGGGSDLIFPHHESEIAQAECVPGRDGPFVRTWIHTGTVFQGSEKMSKSLGNLTFVRDLLQRHDPGAIRRFLLRHHYRRDWAFLDQDLVTYQERLGRAGSPAGGRTPAGGRPRADVAALRRTFFEALEEDLDTPTALEALEAAEAGDGSDAADFAREARAVLGLEA